MGDFKKLDVWKRAHRLTRDVYRTTQTAPTSEVFGLTSQMRRAATSIAANICEGCGRNSDRELARYLRIALGSAAELEYYVLLSGEVGHMSAADTDRMTGELAELRSMIATLARRLAGAAPRLTSDS